MKHVSINEDYPENLVRQILAPEETEALEDDLFPSVEYVLGILTERERDVIYYRFLYGLTYQKTADTIGLSKERIRQIESRALRKMKSPSMIKYIKLGVQGVLREEIKEAKENIDRYIKENNINPDEVDQEKIKYEMLLDKKVEELDLSTRAFTAVKRDNNNTIRDLVKSYKICSIHGTRQCGPKTLQEIYDKLVRFGVPEKELQYDAQTAKVEQAIIEEIRKEERERSWQAAKEKAKELQILREGIISVHDAIIKSGSKSLEMLFSDSILLNLQEHIKSFFPNERVVGLLLKTELYDPESERSPYKDFVKREGFREALKYFKAEGTDLKYGDTQWIRFLYRNLEDISENEGEDSESGKFHFVPSI